MIAILKLISLLIRFNLESFTILTFLGVIFLVKKLTAGVLQGTSYRENMKVEWNGETYEIEIRALNNSEASQIEVLMQEGVTMKGRSGRGGQLEQTMDFDTAKNLLGRKKADVKAVVLGTTDEAITEKVVQNEFPPVLVEQIANRIREISGIAIDDVRQFNEGITNPSN